MKTKINSKWRFYPGGESPFFGVNSEGIEVNLPHDFSISQDREGDSPAGASNAYFPGGNGCYKKTLFIPEDWRGKRLTLEFEGVYMNAAVHVNRNLAVRHPYGYTGFYTDVTDYIEFDKENIISVEVSNSAVPNTRWYNGSGIYRNVWLHVQDEVHIEPWGVYVTTPLVSDKQADVRVLTTVVNKGAYDRNI
jgi:beta-galactosidase